MCYSSWGSRTNLHVGSNGLTAEDEVQVLNAAVRTTIVLAKMGANTMTCPVLLGVMELVKMHIVAI